MGQNERERKKNFIVYLGYDNQPQKKKVVSDASFLMLSISEWRAAKDAAL
jgi:hypothetical protein